MSTPKKQASKQVLEQSIKQGRERKPSLEYRIKRGMRIGAIATLGATVGAGNVYELFTAECPSFQNTIHTSEPYNPLPRLPLRNILPDSTPKNVRNGIDIIYGLITLPGASTGAYLCEQPWREETERE